MPVKDVCYKDQCGDGSLDLSFTSCWRCKPHSYRWLKKSRLLRCLCWARSSGRTLDLRNCGVQCRAIFAILTQPATQKLNASHIFAIQYSLYCLGSLSIISSPASLGSNQPPLSKSSFLPSRILTAVPLFRSLEQVFLI